MSESIQHKLDRVRPPRVQITYDVQIGDAIEKKELPFVMGILSDLSGNSPANPLPRVKDRKFVNLDPDNFNDVLAAIGPGLALRVPDRITNDPDTQINVQLAFKSIDDFSPVSIVNQVEPLRKLFEARQRLNDLLAKLAGNDALDSLLQEVIANTDGLKELQEMTGGNNGEE
jgi:type VI secretion system protein ImpB